MTHFEITVLGRNENMLFDVGIVESERKHLRYMCLATLERADFDVVHAKHNLKDLLQSDTIALADAYLDVVLASANDVVLARPCEFNVVLANANFEDVVPRDNIKQAL